MGILLGIILAGLVLGALILAYFNKNKKVKIISLVCAGVFLIAFAIVPFSIRVVDANEVAVVKYWGEAKDIRTSGTHFNDYISSSYVYYPISVQQIDNEIQAYSQDAQAMTAQLVVQYKIDASKVVNITKEYGDNEVLMTRIQAIAEEKVKSVLSQKQAMAIIETRATLSSDILTAMDGAFDSYYVTITNVVITDISFSIAFEDAVESKMIAEQEQLKAEYEKQKKITEAEALLEVAKKEAEASIEKSKGDAEALQIMQQAWDALSSDVKQAMLQQMAIEKWNGELPDTMVGTEFLEWLMGSIGTGTTEPTF
ncbi:MAG: prohibitin family protein [Clostridia bacterium]|nr:prohibitin family protein [Clostridia bacterium]